MEKILTAKEKWAYAHWCIFPGIFWIISPLNWIAFLLAFFNGFVWFNVFRDFIKPIVFQEEWYYRALVFFIGVVYILICATVSYILVYLCARVYYFLFDKDEFCQKHFKRHHICKNWLCMGCHEEECGARLERDR